MAAGYREVSRQSITGFLETAINDARDRGFDKEAGFRITSVTLTEEAHVVRLDLDNGDIIFFDFKHLVPRGSIDIGAAS